MITAVDLWSDRVGVHYAYEVTTHPLVGPDGHGRPGPAFSLTDDLGTTYESGGGGSGGSGDFAYGNQRFTPAVPETATRLFLSSPDLRDPIEVVLRP